MPKIYLAGPMSGIPDFNFPAFFDYAEALEEGGWEVFNPAQNDIDVHGSLEGIKAAWAADATTTLRQCLNDDLDYITAEADAIAMMPDWENSKGARAEHATAVALGLQIIYLNDDAVI